MSLRAKTHLWLLSILLTFLVSAVVGAFAIRRLVIAESTLREDQVVERLSWRLEQLLTDASILLSQPVTGDRRDARRDVARHIDEFVRAGFGPAADAPVEQAFGAVAPKLSRIAEALRGDRVHPDGDRMVLDASAGMRRVIAETEAVVARELVDGQEIARTYSWALLLLFAATLVVLGFGSLTFHRHILGPLGRLFELINDLRLGKLEVRWTDTRSDEIGRTGRTVSLMAEQLDRMRRERRQFVDSVSHDLKNPIFAISLHCQRSLRKGTALSMPEALRAFEAIGTLCRQASRITDDLQEIVHDAQPIWSLALSSDSLAVMARRWVDEIRVAYPDHPIRLEEVPGSSDAAVDGGRVRQVLANLVANAAKYSAPGSPIDVVVGSNGPEEVFLEVRDRGIGVPDALKERIFEPYARGDEGRAMAHGLGLGLSIVRRIVALHGGRIRVADRNEGGSVFRIMLPRRRPQKETAPSEPLGASLS